MPTYYLSMNSTNNNAAATIGNNGRITAAQMAEKNGAAYYVMQVWMTPAGAKAKTLLSGTPDEKRARDFFATAGFQHDGFTLSRGYQIQLMRRDASGRTMLDSRDMA